MPGASDLMALKRLLSPRLLDVEGVSGLGLPGGKLTVYLSEDTEEVRGRVREVIAKLAPKTELAFEFTGPFRPH